MMRPVARNISLSLRYAPSSEELNKVKGIGEATYSKLTSFVIAP